MAEGETTDTLDHMVSQVYGMSHRPLPFSIQSKHIGSFLNVVIVSPDNK